MLIFLILTHSFIHSLSSKIASSLVLAICFAFFLASLICTLDPWGRFGVDFAWIFENGFINEIYVWKNCIVGACRIMMCSHTHTHTLDTARCAFVFISLITFIVLLVVIVATAVLLYCILFVCSFFNIARAFQSIEDRSQLNSCRASCVASSLNKIIMAAKLIKHT